MKQQNDRCPLQDECERTCKVVEHERDCDYYRANCLPGMDIPGQGINDDGEPPYFEDEDETEEETYTSDCPYFVGMTEPDEEGKRKLLCKTREEPYTGALYDCGCSPDANPGYNDCRLYWLQRIAEDLGAAPQEIRDGSVKAMREFYTQEAARKGTEDDADTPTQQAVNPCAECLCVTCTCTGCHDACFGHCQGCGKPTTHCNSYQTEGMKQISNAPDNAAPAVATPQDPALPAFDYSGLDAQTVATLHSAEAMIRGARRDYVIKVADAVGMAHDELCGTVVHKVDNGQFDNKEETFRAWCASMGIGKTTAYKLLQVSNLICSSTPNEQKILEQASPSLLYAAAKPSAPTELVQGVKDGDITSHKQYKEALERIKALENQNQSLLHSYETEKGKAEAARVREENARQAAHTYHVKAEEAEAVRSALLDQASEYIDRIHELESRPIDVAVAEPDPAEVERLAAEKADAMTAELRRQLKTAENNIRQMHAHTESLKGQLEDWRQAAQRQTPLTPENLQPMARDLASSVTALYNTFLLAACELHGDAYTQCAAPLIDALQDALTGLRGAVNERSANTYKEDEDFER